MFTYRGKRLSAEDIAFINALIAQNPLDANKNRPITAQII